MAFAVSTLNGVKVYHVTSGTKKQSDADFKRRVDILQDLEFPVASNRVKLSPDGGFLISTGTYPPQFAVHDLSELSEKFRRHVDADIVQFHVLTDDWRKIVFLENDRNIEFYAPAGKHYKLRIPKFGRDLVYHYPTCDLFVAAGSNEVYRLNLEQGRFMAPLVTSAESNNVCALALPHGLLAFGGTNGIVECWDPRTRNRVASLPAGVDVPSARDPPEITALRFRDDGLSLAVGTASGHALLYDIRGRHPVTIKDHNYGTPVVALQFHDLTRNVLSSDQKSLKIWNRDSGVSLTTIEAPGDIADFVVFPRSGLLCVAGEMTRLHMYFLPALGPAPRWCAFIENLTEELEEKEAPVYEDYKFVTREELEELSLSHLIGTPLLRAYMHGFFMDLRLYNKARAVSEPFAYEEYRRRRIAEKLAEQQETRVAQPRKVPKVNRELAEKLARVSAGAGSDSTAAAAADAAAAAGGGAAGAAEAGGKTAPGKGKEKDKSAASRSLLQDERFAALWSDPKFQIDKTSAEYRLLHPSEAATDARGRSRRGDVDSEEEAEREVLEDNFAALDDDDDDARSQSSSDSAALSSSSDSAADSDVGGVRRAKAAKPVPREPKEQQKRQKHEGGKSAASAASAVTQPQGKRSVRMFELKPGHLPVLPSRDELEARRAKMAVPLAERVQKETATVGGSGRAPGGVREVTFKISGKRHRKGQ